VHPFRPTAAVRCAENTHPPDTRFRWAAAERVLAGQVIAENEVDVGAWRPGRELGATRVGEGERYNVVGDGPRLSYDQVGLVLPDDGLGGRHCHNRVRLSQQQPTFVWIRTIAALERLGQGTTIRAQPIVRIQIRLGPCAP
jgi:hypothetical protein